MGPLIFFVAIIGIDLLLKNAKNKRQMEEAKIRKMENLKNKKNQEDTKYASKDESRSKREVPQNPSIFRGRKENDFSGEGRSYKKEHEGYRDRYDERYEDMSKKYEDISEGYEDNIYDPVKIKSEGLYDKDAIGVRERKFDKQDIRDYGKEKRKVDIPIPKASTFKRDVLKGIIFSEIIGKPKSMQKKDI